MPRATYAAMSQQPSPRPHLSPDPGSSTGTPRRASRGGPLPEAAWGGAARSCPGGSEGGGEEAPLSRGNGVRDPETGGGQARMRLEPGALGTQRPEQAQGHPQGQEQSLAPLGLHPVGTLDPHSPPVEGHQQGAPVSGCVPAPASGHRQGCRHPGQGAAQDVPLSPGPTCREDSQEVCGLGASGHSPHCPPAKSWLPGEGRVGARQLPPPISASRMSGMLMTSAGELSICLMGFLAG